MTTDIVGELAAETMREAATDDIGLWIIVDAVARRVGPELVQTTVLAIVAKCLGEGAMAGQFDKNGFAPWMGSAEDVCDRIVVEWRRLGREPDLGEIAWIVLPPVKTFVR